MRRSTMTRKFLAGTLLAVMMTGMLAGCGGSTGSPTGQPAGTGDTAGTEDLPNVTFTIGHNNTGPTVVTFIADEFKRLLEEKSGGKITVEVYPGAQLGSDPEVVDSVAAGDVTFVVTNPSNVVPHVADASVFDIPFLFDSAEKARVAIDNREFRAILDQSFQDAGLRLLMASDMGFRELSTNVKVDSYESLKSMNLRTMDNAVHIAFWKAVGINPMPMNQSEVFLSLQQGLIDGQENPYMTMDNFSLQDVQKYFANTHHIFHLVMVVGNNEYLASLPQAYQDMIQETVDEVLTSSRKMADDDTETYRQKLINEGMTFIDIDQIDGMRQQMMDATADIDQLVRQNVTNEEIVNAYLKAAGR